MKAIVEGFRTITATILESNHLACFVALVTIKHFKLRSKRKRSVLMSGEVMQVESINSGVTVTPKTSAEDTNMQLTKIKKE